VFASVSFLRRDGVVAGVCLLVAGCGCILECLAAFCGLDVLGVVACCVDVVLKCGGGMLCLMIWWSRGRKVLGFCRRVVGGGAVLRLVFAAFVLCVFLFLLLVRDCYVFGALILCGVSPGCGWGWLLPSVSLV